MTPDEQRAKARERSKRYYAEHKDVHKQRVRRWQAAHPDLVREYSRRSYLKTPEKAAEYQRRWQARNREKIRQTERAKRQRDVQFRMAGQIRVMMGKILSGEVQTGKYVDLLGCGDWYNFRLHIESKFTDGMTWATRGRFGWHLDHVTPLSAFDLTDERQLRAACHFTNVQPLWWRDNMRKGPKLALADCLRTD